MGINSVNQQFRGLGRVAEESVVVANSTGAYYEENGVQYFFGDDGLLYSPNNQILDTALANLAFNTIADNLQPRIAATQARLGVTDASWAKLVAKYKEMTGKKYILEMGTRTGYGEVAIDRNLYFDDVEIEAAIKSIREALAKDAAANAPQMPQTTQMPQASQVPIPQPLPAPIPLEAFSSFSLDAPTTTIPLPKTLSKAEDTKDNTLLYVGIGAGVLALCGGAYWYFSK